jgi:peptidoglycan/LPS O-acetylase OafA/YrhL
VTDCSASLSQIASPCAGYPADGWLQHATFTQTVQQYWFASALPFIRTFSPSWSVAVEEQFYLFWPVALRLSGGRAAVPLTLVALIRFRGHVPKGGYDVPNGQGCSGPASPATVL